MSGRIVTTNPKALVLTMISLALVELINMERRHEFNETTPEGQRVLPALLRHDNFMAKIESHPGIDSPKFLGQYKDSTGRTLKCYQLPKRECELMIMSESLMVQARMYDRLVKLEEQAKPAFTLPDFTNPAIAARAWADAMESSQETQAALALAAPKVAFVEFYVDSTGLQGFRQVAKLLQLKENWFRKFLADRKIMYRLGSEWMPYAPHIEAGRFEVKTGTSMTNGHSFNEAKFTPKGIKWIAGLIASKRVSNVLKAGK